MGEVWGGEWREGQGGVRRWEDERGAVGLGATGCDDGDDDGDDGDDGAGEMGGGLIRGCRDETGNGCVGSLARESGIFLYGVLRCLCFEAVRKSQLNHLEEGGEQWPLFGLLRGQIFTNKDTDSLNDGNKKQ